MAGLAVARGPPVARRSASVGRHFGEADSIPDMRESAASGGMGQTDAERQATAVATTLAHPRYANSALTGFAFTNSRGWLR